MNNTPNSNRLHILIAGRANAGKSSLFNFIADQDVAIVSPEPGTTTDAVTKAMELWPVGPVLLIDSAGFGDMGILGGVREERSRREFDRADVIILLFRNGAWGAEEEEILQIAGRRKIPVVGVLNLFPGEVAEPETLAMAQKACDAEILSVNLAERDHFLSEFKERLLEILPDELVAPPELLGDLVSAGDVMILVVPVDDQAPKGRLILPQAQTIRDGLDHGALVLTVRDSEYPEALKKLPELPKLVICDSQVVGLMNKHTPAGVPCTTFSILFSRQKGDFAAFLAGTEAIGQLRDGDKILIAEGCSHHSTEVDIGRVKIPRMLQEKTGKKLIFEVCSGRDYPTNLAEYRLVIHCGGCMLNRRETLRRIMLAREAGVPITNYGMAISWCAGIFDRVTAPLR